MKSTIIKSIIAIIFLACNNTGLAQAPGANQRGASMQSVLLKVPQKVKREFIESIYFVNGKIASFKFTGLKRSLVPFDYSAFLSSIGWGSLQEVSDHENYCCSGAGECKYAQTYICSPAFCTGVKGSQVSDLKTVPQADLERYLNSLDFADGRLVNGDLALIARFLKKAELDQLPSFNNKK